MTWTGTILPSPCTWYPLFEQLNFMFGWLPQLHIWEVLGSHLGLGVSWRVVWLFLIKWCRSSGLSEATTPSVCTFGGLLWTNTVVWQRRHSSVYMAGTRQGSETVSLKANSYIPSRASAVLRGSPRGRRKKPNLGRPPTGRWAVNSHVHAVLCCGLEK